MSYEVQLQWTIKGVTWSTKGGRKGRRRRLVGYEQEGRGVCWNRSGGKLRGWPSKAGQKSKARRGRYGHKTRKKRESRVDLGLERKGKHKDRTEAQRQKENRRPHFVARAFQLPILHSTQHPKNAIHLRPYAPCAGAPVCPGAAIHCPPIAPGGGG